MTTHLSLQRMLLPTAQVSSLTTGSITLPGARTAFDDTTFELIATNTPSGSNSASFTSIPQTYKHLQMRGVINETSGVAEANLRFNNISTSSYNSYQYGVYYSGSNILRSWEGVNTYIPLNGFWIQMPISNYTTVFIATFLNYTSTTDNKSVHYVAAHIANTTDYEYFQGYSTFNSATTALSRLDVTLSGANYATGSRVSLYGMNTYA